MVRKPSNGAATAQTCAVLKNYGSGNQGLYDTFDGKENTDVIIETLAGVKDTQGTVGAPAAEVARAYKACTLESDGIEDTTVWNLPALGELMLMVKYKTEINELITSMFGNQNIFTNDWYWSSTEYDASSSWNVGFSSGSVSATLTASTRTGFVPSPQ